MKKLLLFIVIVSGLGTQGWSQIEKEYLDSLYKKFIDSHQKYEKLSEQFKTYKNKISINSLEKNTEKLQEIKPKIDSLLKELKKIRKRVWVFKSHYEGLKIELDTGIIRKIREIKERRIDTIKTEAHESLLKIYNYYSDYLVVDEEELKINQKTLRFLRNYWMKPMKKAI